MSANVSLDETKSTEEKPSLKELLKNKSYVLVFGGQLTNFIAGMLVGMTFSYLIYATTQNAALMALMNVIGILPQVIIVTFAGLIVDRFDQRKIIFISMVLRFIVFLGFLMLFIFQDYMVMEYTGLKVIENGGKYLIHFIDYTHFIWPMYTLLFISNIGSTFLGLSVNAYSKYIVEKKNLLVANSFSQTVTQIASVIGPIAAGALITVSYLSSFIVGTIIICGAGGLALVLQLKGKQPPLVLKEEKTSVKGEIKKVFSDLRVGYTATKAEPKILFALIFYTIFNFGAASINGTYTVVTQGEMGLNPTWLGAANAVTASIAILTSLIIMKIGKIDKKLILVILVVFLEAVGLFIVAFNRNPWVFICVNLIPFGFVNGAANIPTQTLRQETYPHEIQGRIFSIACLLTSLGNLIGNIIVTSIANYVQPKYILLFGGAICLLLGSVGLILYLKNPSLNCSDYSAKVEVVKPPDKIKLDTKFVVDSIPDLILKNPISTKEEIVSLE